MKAGEFHTWLRRLAELTLRQRGEVKVVLDRELAGVDAQEVVNRRSAEVLSCPHCQAGRIHRWGKDGGVQRYRCCVCGKTFNALSGTPLARLKRSDAWLAYAQAMIDGASIRQAAQRAGVHRTTSFRWRHRLLRQPATENDAELSGIVEIDETYFLESHKGERHLPRPARHRGGHAAQRGLSAEQIPVLVAQDRQGKHFDTVLNKADKATLGVLLPQLVAPESMLCTDGAKVYRAVTKEQAIAHQPLNLAAGTRVKQQIFHIQHVNAYDSRLKQWMRRFNGVATKYLPNYLGWRRLLEHCGKAITPEAVLRHAVG